MKPGSKFCVGFLEPNNARYLSQLYDQKTSQGVHELTCIFSACQWVHVSAVDDPDFRLDTSNLSAFSVGVQHLGAARQGHGEVWKKDYEIDFEILSLELVKY
jgi:hypothetical protein